MIEAAHDGHVSGVVWFSGWLVGGSVGCGFDSLAGDAFEFVGEVGFVFADGEHDGGVGADRVGASVGYVGFAIGDGV